MAVITLDEIKTHLRLELSDTSQDEELTRLEAVAVDAAAQFIGRSIPWQDETGADVAVPESVKQALLIMIAGFDQQREDSVIAASYTKIPTAENMLHFYRVGLGI